MRRMRYCAACGRRCHRSWALGSRTGPGSKTVVIDAVDSPAAVFQPASTTIEVGDTVRWEFDQAARPTRSSRRARTGPAIDGIRGPNGAPINADVHHGRHLQLPVRRPQRHDRHDHRRGPDARPRARVLQDRRLPPRLDPAGHRGDPGARHGQRLRGRRHRGRRRSSRTPTSRTFDVVVFMSTTGEVLNDAQQTAFENYIKAGGGFAGVHAASDTEYTWPWFGELVGGYFRNHPAGTPPRRSTSRTATSPPRPASRRAGRARTSGTTSSTRSPPR